MPEGLDLSLQEDLRNSLRAFIKSVINEYGTNIFIARVIQISNTDLRVKILNISENIEVSWSEGLLIILDQQQKHYHRQNSSDGNIRQFVVNDNLVMVSYNGGFIVLGKAIDNLGELTVRVTS